MSEPPLLRRSLLFVPGAEPRKLDRARESAADALLLDLEDAVAPERKDEARAEVAARLGSRVFGDTDVAVRVNAPETPWFAADLGAIVPAGARTILLPKAETPEGVAAVAEALGRLERATSTVRLLLLVETPLGIVNAAVLGRVSPRVDALLFGHVDFAREMGLPDADASQGTIHHARSSLVIAARACGVGAIDCVHLAVKDEGAFREDTVLGLRLGYDGKLCIHPRQAEIANEVYTPGAKEIDSALRVIEGAGRAETEGRGVFVLDGRMIDAPVVAAARRVLDRARRAGALPGNGPSRSGHRQRDDR